MSTITYGTNKEAKGLEKAIAALKNKKEEIQNTADFEIGLEVEIIESKFGGHPVGTIGKIVDYHGEVPDGASMYKSWVVVGYNTGNNFFHREQDLRIIKSGEKSGSINSGTVMAGPTPSISPRAKPKTLYQTNIENLATQIKTLRTAKGWSQRDLAVACGYSQGTITRAENNMWISITCLIRIANALGLQIAIT